MHKHLSFETKITVEISSRISQILFPRSFNFWTLNFPSGLSYFHWNIIFLMLQKTFFSVGKKTRAGKHFKWKSSWKFSWLPFISSWLGWFKVYMVSVIKFYNSLSSRWENIFFSRNFNVICFYFILNSITLLFMLHNIAKLWHEVSKWPN